LCTICSGECRFRRLVISKVSLPSGLKDLHNRWISFSTAGQMYVRPCFRGLGFAKLLLDHLATYARTHGVGLLRLETGIHQAAAINFYERAGFQRIPPFGAYGEDPLSLFYEKRVG
jgi:GNAT superfamily N-acetyltransferase